MVHAYSNPALFQTAGTRPQLRHVDSQDLVMHYWAAVLSQALWCCYDCCPAAYFTVAVCI